MTASAPNSSPERDSNYDGQIAPSPMKPNDEEETLSSAVFSESSKLSDPSAKTTGERVDMIVEEFSQIIETDGEEGPKPKKSVAEKLLENDLNEAKPATPPTSPGRGTYRGEDIPTAPAQIIETDGVPSTSSSKYTSTPIIMAASAPLKTNEGSEDVTEEESNQTIETDGGKGSNKRVAKELLSNSLDEPKPATTPASPERGTDQGEETITAPARRIASPPRGTESSTNSEKIGMAVATTPVRMQSLMAGDLTKGLDSEADSEERDAVPPIEPPGRDENPKRPEVEIPPNSKSLLSATSPSIEAGELFSGISADHKEHEKYHGVSAKHEATLPTRKIEDDLTVPESPPKSIDDRPKTDKLSAKKLHENEETSSGRRSNCCLAATFCCLVILVLGAAGFFTYLLIQPEPAAAPTTAPSQIPTFSIAPSTSPSSVPTSSSEVPSIAPSIETLPPSPAPSSSPSSVPSMVPSVLPSISPSNVPSIAPTERDPAIHLIQILSSASTSLKNRIQNNLDSRQRAAFDWLIKDPDFFDYNERKLVQRFVLALFSLELKAPQTRRGLRSRRLNWNALETWRQYTDECSWFTAYYGSRTGCDRTGTWKRLVLYNLDLGGTLPSELALLTRMETLILNNHRITGTLPPELATLRTLQTVHLSGNRFTGTIPTQFGQLTLLKDLDLSRNFLIQTIPTQLGMLQQLKKLDLSENALDGNIPIYLGSYNLAIIDLHKNLLVGAIPTHLGKLKDLVYLDVRNNLFGPPFPNEVCALNRPYNEGFAMEIPNTMFKSDCGTTNCTCCSHCS